MDENCDASSQTWVCEAPVSSRIKRREMNELIMDYLVREGFKEAAETFYQEAGINPMNLKLKENIDNDSMPQETTINSNNTNNNTNNNNSAVNSNHQIINNNHDKTISCSTNNNHSGDHNNDAHNDGDYNDDISPLMMFNGVHAQTDQVESGEMMDRRVKIRELIESGDMLGAQSLMNQYYPELLDNNRNILFRLQQQHLIELIRQQKINDVLIYVQNHLTMEEYKNSTEMEKTLALLAYENPDKSPCSGLLSRSRKLQLASDVNDVILQETIGDLEISKPRLVTLLKLLIWTQNELEKKKITYPKMTDMFNGTIYEHNWKGNNDKESR